jgi:hypothetical protein
MFNFIGVVICVLAMAWLLLVHRPRAEKTLAAWRWMVLSWVLLFSVLLFNPIKYLSYRLSAGTVVYCLLWIGCFALGDNMGYLSYRRCAESSADSQRLVLLDLNRNRLFVLTLLSVIGLIALGMKTDFCSVIRNGAGLAQLRANQVLGVNEGLLKTVATLLASVGLVAFLMYISSAILSDKRIRWVYSTGLVAYMSIYFMTGGRSGLVITGIASVVALVASLQLLKMRYRHLNFIIVVMALVVILGYGYFARVVTTRTFGWEGAMDDKITVMNNMFQSRLDERFRESLRSLGFFGDAITEGFYYLSPQLYGLEYGFSNYSGKHGWGAVQFAFITRRVEALFHISVFEGIINEYRWSFEKSGLAANFFRTAVDTTFLDFGLILGLPFIWACGFLAGRLRGRALHVRSPYAIAFQALICAGAAWTIIYSPFGEIGGWSLPLLWFIALGFAMKRPRFVEPSLRRAVL